MASGTFVSRALVIAFINAAIFGMPMTLWMLVWTEKSAVYMPRSAVGIC